MDAPLITNTEEPKIPAQSAGEQRLAAKYQQVRDFSVHCCQPLTVEDFGLQAIVETSPPKWHLAHTTWFFETFVLKVFCKNYRCFDSHFEVLFNSYYNGIGLQHPRAQRGLLSRPSLDTVHHYRQTIDNEIRQLLNQVDHAHYQDICARIVLGMHHERQHQELFFTDLKYCWYQNPILPVYCETALSAGREQRLGWQHYSGGICDIGHKEQDFCFDNELPHHQIVLTPFALTDRLSTNGDFLQFIQEGGYQNPEWWLADGWHEVLQQQWRAPLYWQQRDGQWFEYTLHGLQPLDLNRPVVHVSAYEADAFARWCGARLPTEQELELALVDAAATHGGCVGQFVDSGEYHPGNCDGQSQLFGSAWQWTSSAYGPYPGFQPAAGALGEYNGKFMCNQWVLRGGSCVTSRDHIRSSYRNFFYPRDRWQFSGIRLAKTL